MSRVSQHHQVVNTQDTEWAEAADVHCWRGVTSLGSMVKVEFELA